MIRAIRDYFHPEIGEILIDTEDVFNQAKTFVDLVMPDVSARVKRYRDDVPLFSRFQIEHQIETAHSRQVPLPSGGAIVIDHTEALVAIDVNSAQATRGSDIEETALRTNLEAADEVARQLRLRDLGGLIVIDFIDMEDARNQRAVEQRAKDALHHDRARVQMGKISRFGMMELSRQRLRPALSEGSHVTCPRCNGVGQVRDTESSALHILRILQEEAMKENTAALHAQVPVDVATYLLNEKRPDLAKLEARLKVSIVLIPNKFLETPHYNIERLKHDDERLDVVKPSYDRVSSPSEDQPYLPGRAEESRNKRQEAVVKGVVPDTPAPVVVVQAAPARAAAATPSIWSRILAWFAPAAPTEPAAAAAVPASGTAGRGRPDRERDRDRDQGRGRGRGERRPDRREPRPERAGSERAPQARGERPERERDQSPRRDRPAAAARPEQNEERSGRRNRPGDGAGRPPRDGRKPAAAGAEAPATVETHLPATMPAEATTTPQATSALVATPAEAAGNGEEKRGRRRRRRGRGGSDRGERAGGAAQGDLASDESLQDDPSEAAPRDMPNAQAPMPAFERPAPREVPAAAPAMPAYEQPPARHVQPPPAERPVEPAPMPVAELVPIVESSGLTLAQTDPAKLAAARARAEALQPPPPRIGRERPALAPAEEAPLTQVETRGQP